VSARTFARRLAIEVTTYEDVVDELRRSLALQYLKEPGMSLSQISWLLGYEGSTSSTMLSDAGPVIRRPGSVGGSRFLRLHKRPDSGSRPPDKSDPIGPRTQKIGTREQAAARDISYLISGRPSMTQGPGTSYDAGKLAQRSR
jgi:hypothetical protein